jgi:hypothetical protein
MSEGVLRFYQLAEVCRDRAAQARNSIDAESWQNLLRTGSNSHEPTSKGATTARLRAALHPINGDQKIWPLEHFHQSVQDDALVIPRPWF